MMRSGGPRATTVQYTARRIKNWWGGERANRLVGAARAPETVRRRRRAAVETLKPLPKKIPRE